MRLYAIAASTLLAFTFSVTASATVRTWSQTGNGSTGSWTNGGLWSPSGVPQPADDLKVTMSGNYSCTTSSNFTIQSLTVGGSGGGTKTVEVSKSTSLAMANKATLNSSATLSVRGVVSNGRLDVNSGALLHLRSGSMVTGDNSINIAGGILLNEGSELRNRDLVVTSIGGMNQAGSLVLGDGSTIRNDGFIYIYGGNISRGTGAGGSITNNKALRMKTTDPVTIGVNVTNNGEFEVGSGHVTFSGATYTQTAGKTTLGGGSLAAPISLTGGTLTGTGTVGDVSNGGTISLASPVSVGQLSVTGTFTQLPTGVLQIKIGSASDFDKLSIGGLATLGGQISLVFINNFVPTPGMQFPVLSFGTWGNTFFSIQNGFQVGNVVIQPLYSSTGLTLVAQLAHIACGTDSLCVIGERFDVTLNAKDPRTGNTGPGVPTQQNDLFGYFTIPALTGNAQNPEVIFKMLDGRAVNGKFWVFYGGLTDFEYTITIFDRTTGAIRTYTKPGGTFNGNADTSAFSKRASATPSASWLEIEAPVVADAPGSTGEAACLSSVDALCVLNGRFRLRLAAVDPRTGKTGTGLALPQNDLYGYFSIPDLTGNAGNVEVAVKMLDGRSVNGKFWIFYGGLTDFQYTITVTDTDLNVTKSYTKPGGTFAGNADTSAF